MSIFSFFSKHKQMGELSVNKKVKIGLALGGGGARGIGHIGVLKAFEELGIQFDYIAGTSVGSLAGCFYAYGKTASELESFVKKVKKSDIFRGSIPFLKPAKPVRLEDLINNYFGDITVFSEMKIPFCAVCTDLKTGKEVDFDYGNVAKVVSGSCAVPGIFTPVVYEDMHLIDGGLRNNVPADIVRKMGANVVFAVDVNHLRGTGTDSLSTISVLSSTIGIMMQAKVDETMRDADLIFTPALATFSPLKFENIDEMIKIGYDTVMANKEKIKQILHIPPNKIDKYFARQ